jgi:uncharacterized alpha/beta hydrolase family protein
MKKSIWQIIIGFIVTISIGAGIVWVINKIFRNDNQELEDLDEDEFEDEPECECSCSKPDKESMKIMMTMYENERGNLRKLALYMLMHPDASLAPDGKLGDLPEFKAVMQEFHDNDSAGSYDDLMDSIGSTMNTLGAKVIQARLEMLSTEAGKTNAIIGSSEEE